MATRPIVSAILSASRAVPTLTPAAAVHRASKLPEGRTDFRQRENAAQNELASSQIFGENKNCQFCSFPALPDTRPAFQRRVLCFWV
jgi:hypothetical protein